MSVTIDQKPLGFVYLLSVTTWSKAPTAIGPVYHSFTKIH